MSKRRFCRRCGTYVLATGQVGVWQCWACSLNQNAPLAAPVVEWTRGNGQWRADCPGFRISVFKAVDAWGWNVYRTDDEGSVREAVAASRRWDKVHGAKLGALGALALQLAKLTGRGLTF